jgi:hypothetical protein
MVAVSPLNACVGQHGQGDNRRVHPSHALTASGAASPIVARKASASRLRSITAPG